MCGWVRQDLKPRTTFILIVGFLLSGSWLVSGVTVSPVAAQQTLPTVTRPPAPIPTLPPAPPDGLDPIIAQRADTDLLTSRLAVGLVQSSYQAAHGAYWQAAPTHSDPPRIGQNLPPNPLARVSDNPAWYDMGIDLPSDMPVSVRVDVYDGPHGSGYVIIGALCDDGGTIWERSVNVGPELWRDHNWRQCQDAP